MSCDCYCSVVLPHGVVGWSAACDCVISSHIFLIKSASYHNDPIKQLFDWETPFCIPGSFSITQYSVSPIVFSSLNQLMQIIINIKFAPDYFDTYGNSKPSIKVLSTISCF